MKRMKILILLASLLPFNTFSQNSGAQVSGLSDGMLLALMICFIVLLLAIIKALSKSIEGISKLAVSKRKTKKEHHVKVITTFFLLSSSFAATAAETTPSVPAFVMSDLLFWVLIGVIVFLTIVIGILFRSLLILIKLEKGETFEEEEETADLLKTLKLTDNVPLEVEATVMMDHEYDGIRELDNNLPPWWKYMFYATIVFAFVYLIRFHISGNGLLQQEEYLAEVAEAEEAKASILANSAETITDENVVFLIDEVSIAKGAAIYKGNCATCHGQLGEGGAGPNLTDEYWLHGGGIKNVFKNH